MKRKDNNDIIQSTENLPYEMYKAKYQKRKSSVTVKDTVIFTLPDKQVLKLFFRNGKLINGESKDLSQDEVNKITQQLKDLYN